MRLLVGLLFVTTCLIGPLYAQSKGQQKLNGRIYYIHVPKEVKDPVLLVWCHPASGDAKTEFDWWKTSLKADKIKNTILLAPQAAGRNWVPAKDAKFVSALIKKIQADHKISNEKIIMGGHSSGAIFTYNYGLKNQKTFHTLVPAAGYQQGGIARAGTSSPLIALYHSKNDPVFKFNNAEAAYQKFKKGGYAISFTIDKVQHNIYPPLSKRVAEIIAEMNFDVKKRATNESSKKLFASDENLTSLLNANQLKLSTKTKDALDVDLKSRSKIQHWLQQADMYNDKASKTATFKADHELIFSLNNIEVGKLLFDIRSKQVQLKMQDKVVGTATLKSMTHFSKVFAAIR